MMWAGYATQQTALGELDALVQKRDVAAIQRFVDAPKNNTQYLSAISTGGPYEGGRFGWHAAEAASPSGPERFVVFTTPLTAEDIGEYVFLRNGNRLRLIPEDDPLGAQILRHKFEIRFDIPAATVSILDHITVQESANPLPVIIRLGSEFKVSLVQTASGKPVKFSQAGGTLFVARSVGKQEFTLTYAGKPDKPTYSGSITADEATLSNGIWYPMIARLPAPYSETVHGPKGWITIGQGEKTEEATNGDDHVVSYRMDLPVVWYSLATGPYKVQEVKAGGRRFFAASPRFSAEILHAQASTYPAIISFYERFGIFPFSGYGGLDSPNYGGGALEAYSYATYGGPFPEEDAHEPSHTWWGGIVDNTYLHSFWNESFADFSDQFYRRNAPIGNDAERRLAFMDDGGSDPSYDRFACATCGAYSGPDANGLGYGKGAKVLQMLELLMGSADLTKAMHGWVADQKPGTAAEWSDFEKEVDKVRPDLKLADFFADWIKQPGHLELDATANYHNRNLRLSLDWKGKPFRVPLQVMLEYPDGRDVLKTLDLRGQPSISIPSAQKPSLVSVDPYRILIRPISDTERPAGIQSSRGFTQVVDPAHLDWKQADGYTTEKPADFVGKMLLGSPESWPELKPLFDKVGFKVSGNKLTYDGTTIDLGQGSAVALVDLGDGKSCLIGCGKSRIEPNPGRARLGVFDDLGRFLRGKTDFKRSGNLTFNL